MNTDSATTETTTTTERSTAPRVTFRGRPSPSIKVAIPQRITAEDRALFPEFEGREKLDAAAAEIASMVENKVNVRAARLQGVTPYAAEYITARALWLVSKAVS